MLYDSKSYYFISFFITLFINDNSIKTAGIIALFYFNILNADWDLGVCLEYECKRKQLFKPVFLNSWIDLRVTYKVRVKGGGMFIFLLLKND